VSAHLSAIADKCADTVARDFIPDPNGNFLIVEKRLKKGSVYASLSQSF
jgi:hypothetical protein